MKVEDIIKYALTFAGRDDVARAIENGEMDESAYDEMRTAVLCFNAVEDELARYYFPLKTEEKFITASGEIEFEDFAERPIKILSVKCGSKECEFEVLPDRLKTRAGVITIEHYYAPKRKELSGVSEYTDSAISMSLIAAGTASEYCLLSGDAIAAGVWEAKYRREIDTVLRNNKHSGVKIPPRRWV